MEPLVELKILKISFALLVPLKALEPVVDPYKSENMVRTIIALDTLNNWLRISCPITGKARLKRSFLNCLS